MSKLLENAGSPPSKLVTINVGNETRGVTRLDETSTDRGPTIEVKAVDYPHHVLGLFALAKHIAV
jgi:hypothetical protein